MKFTANEKLKSHDCSHYHSVLCTDDRLILVQEMKTWEEAFQHCKKLKAVDPTDKYHLASFSNAYNAHLDRNTIGLNATSNEV